MVSRAIIYGKNTLPTSPPFDLIAMLTRLRQQGLGSFLDNFEANTDEPQNSSFSSSERAATTGAPVAPARFPNEPDFMGRLPGFPGYMPPPGQLSGDARDQSGLITFPGAARQAPEAMVINEDGLLVENPMAKAFKARQAAGEEASRQAHSEESDTLIDELSRQKARKDAAEDQAWAERSAQSAANFEADMQARGAQRSAPRRAGTQRIGRATRSRSRV